MKTPILLLLLPVIFVGCELPRSEKPELEDMTASAAFVAPGTEAIWEIVLYEFGEAQLRLDDRETEPARSHFESTWVNYPSPYRFEGERKKIVGEIVPVEGSPDSYRVHLITWVQRNASDGDPLDLSQAIWQDVEPDPMVTNQLLYRIERHFAR